jgi:hypothetical protein
MSDLDRYFQSARPGNTTHPMLLWLDEWLGEHPTERPRVQFERPFDGFVFGQAWLTLVFPKLPGRERHVPVREPWDKSYDDGLLARHIQAVDRKQESARFALGMIKDFEPIELRVGKDYFSTLFVHCLRISPLGSMREVKSALAKVTAYRPLLESQRSADSLRETERVLAARGQVLTLELKYPRAEAEEILGAALAAYLDERFHIRLRRHLGMG